MKGLLAQTQPTQLSKTSLQTVGNISGLSERQIQDCAKWHAGQIRKLQLDVAAAAIGEELSRLAMQYGVREKPAPDVVKECLSLIGLKFSFLAPSELREAYRQWASNEIDVKGGEMYGGQINARQVGAVLSAYSLARREKMGRYLFAVEEQRERQNRAKKEAEKKAAFEEAFSNELREAIENAEDWRDVKSYWFKVLEDREELVLTVDQKWSVYNECEKLAIDEEKRRVHENIGNGRLFEEVAKRQNIQKNIAEKMAVFKFYITPKRNLK